MWIHWSHIHKQFSVQDEHKKKQRKTIKQLGLLDFSALAKPGITVILGPKGSGKSTLLKLTAAVMLPDDGRITFQLNDNRKYVWSRGSVITSGTSSMGDLKEQIGYVPDIKRVRYESSCEEALMHVAQLRRLSRPRAKVAALMTRWGLAGYRHEELQSLSTSVLKRYLLGQSLLLQPTFWLLDEPTKGLDPLGRYLLMEELQKHRKQRITLLATEDMELAEIADEIILLEYGMCRRMGNRKILTSSVTEGTVAAWYKTMQTFSHVRSQ